MLNIKKVSIIKAVLFGLVLSNTSVAAAGAGGALPDVADVAPVGTFLAHLHVPFVAFDDQVNARQYYDILAGHMLNAYAGAFYLNHYAKELQGQANPLLLTAALNWSIEKFGKLLPTYHLNDRDRNSLKILADESIVDSRAALRAAYTIEEMPEAEFNLRVLVYGILPLTPAAAAECDYIGKLIELRDAIEAYVGVEDMADAAPMD